MRHLRAHARNARGPAHQHHAVNFTGADAGIAQRALAGRERAFDQGINQGMQYLARQLALPAFAVAKINPQWRPLRTGQRLLGGAGVAQQAAHLFVPGVILDSGRDHDPFGDGMVHVITAEGGIATGGHDLEHAAVQAQQGNIESAAAQVVNRVNALRIRVESIGDCRGGGFVQQAQHIQAREPRGVLGRLALGVVEIGRHGDDGIADLHPQGLRGALFE